LLLFRPEEVDIPDPDEEDDEEAIIEQRRLARKAFEQVINYKIYILPILQIIGQVVVFCYCSLELAGPVKQQTNIRSCTVD